MEALKGIETDDKEEKAALGFLTLDKSNWVVKEKTDEFTLTYNTIQIENPLTNTPEEKVAFWLEVNLKNPVESIIQCLNDYNIRKNFEPYTKKEN